MQAVGWSGLLGRDRELRVLGRGLSDAVEGHGQLVVLAGEAGIGKTHLLDAVADRATAGGLTTGRGMAPAGGAPAYHVWSAALNEVGVDHPLHPEGSPDADRLQVFDGVIRSLHGRAREETIVLLLDDLHWADADSLRLLGHLAPTLRRCRVLLVAAYRDTELDGPDDADPIAAAARYGRYLPLTGLTPDDVGMIVAAERGRPASGDTVAEVHRRSAGNPLFARELARLLDADGAVPPELPATVRAVLGDQLSALDAEVGSVLEVAAVLGADVDCDVLAEVSGLDTAELLRRLESAQRRRLLAVDELGRTAQFRHALVQAAVLGRLGRAELAAHHAAIVSALERMASRGRGVSHETLALHLLASGRPDHTARGIEHARAAAGTAMDSRAYEAAATQLRSALTALAADPSAGDRIDLLLALADAERAAGEVARSRDAYREASTLAAAAGRAEDVARAALGCGAGGFEVTLTDLDDVALLTQARVGLGERPSALRALVDARLSVATTLLTPPSQRSALTDDAVAMARAVADPVALAGALAARCDAVAGPADAESRLAMTEEALALALDAGDRQTELLVRRLRVVGHLECGDVLAMDAEVEAYARVAGYLGQAVYQWYVPLWRGARALMRGDLPDLTSATAEARRIGERAGSHNSALLSLTQEFIGLVEEDPARACDTMRAVEHSHPELGLTAAIAVAWTVAAAGETDSARARADSFDEAALDRLPLDSEWLATLCQLIEIAVVLGGHRVGDWAAEQGSEHGSRMAVEGIAAATHGAFHRHLGLAASLRGDVSAARDHFDEALAINRAAGAPQLVARTHLDSGRLLGSRADLDVAHALYRRMGMSRRAAEAAELLDRAPTVAAGGAPPVAAGRPSGRNAFRLDGEVWTAAYDGLEVRLRDAKGLHDLARLLAAPGREHSALDLVTSLSPRRSRREAAGHLPTDTGPVIDERARRAYRSRLVELQQELDDAEADGDTERAARARAERDALVDQLSSAYGLGGRARRTGDPAERARTAVTWRLRDAIARVEAVHPVLGRHLRHAVRTGTFCAYDPETSVTWDVHVRTS